MIVLDCSAALGIARQTVDGLALKGRICSGEKVVAPVIFQAEAANAIFKNVRFRGVLLDEELDYLQVALGEVDEFAPIEDLITEAVSEGIRLNHPVYDMFYFVLARRLHATVATLDRGLMKLCVENGVDCIEEIAL